MHDLVRDMELCRPVKITRRPLWLIMVARAEQATARCLIEKTGVRILTATLLFTPPRGGSSGDNPTAAVQCNLLEPSDVRFERLGTPAISTSQNGRAGPSIGLPPLAAPAALGLEWCIHNAVTFVRTGAIGRGIAATCSSTGR
jgi:hypothetical protein